MSSTGAPSGLHESPADDPQLGSFASGDRPPLRAKPAITVARFPTAAKEPAQAGPAHSKPAPPPRRNKGRLTVALLTVLFIGAVSYGVWDAFFRFRAVGIVEARLVHLSPSADGTIVSMHGAEGEQVEAGQLLAIVRDYVADEERARVEGELMIATAELDARLAVLGWGSQESADRNQKAAGEYYQALAQLAEEEAVLADRSARLDRLNLLSSERTVTPEELDQARFAVDGQSRKVEQLRQAASDLRVRMERTAGRPVEAADQLKPNLARIEALKSQLRRLHERAGRGELRSPVRGRVVRRSGFAGEQIRQGEPLFLIQEQGSATIVLYMTQRDAELLEPGSEVEVGVDSVDSRIACRVERTGDELRPPPANLKRHYLSEQLLLPVVLRPLDRTTAEMLRPGEVATFSWARSMLSRGESSQEPFPQDRPADPPTRGSSRD
jgi:multidrug resistance efflux pump